MNDLNATSARRSGAAIMGRLIVLVKPLVPIMVLAILLGSVGYLCAIFITILAAFGISAGLEGAFAGASFSSEALVDMPVAGPVGIPVLFVALAVMAVARGLLHYGEQYCNHFIAFRLLAIVRHRVFAVLRTLCPAKLEGRDKGDLVSLITSDIELLEVFYAHTISPIAIAVIVSACMAAFISTQSAAVALVALAGYTVVGVLIPIAHGRRGAQVGFAFRESFARMNGFIL
ncbi:MAG: ABC transporter transmembrane domain-containing protein, partial [Slackia sp.]|nr:ABC transporter transmembrane domain-containing protein [Slackia sp.]